MPFVRLNFTKRELLFRLPIILKTASLLIVLMPSSLRLLLVWIPALIILDHLEPAVIVLGIRILLRFDDGHRFFLGSLLLVRLLTFIISILLLAAGVLCRRFLLLLVPNWSHWLHLGHEIANFAHLRHLVVGEEELAIALLPLVKGGELALRRAEGQVTGFTIGLEYVRILTFLLRLHVAD